MTFNEWFTTVDDVDDLGVSEVVRHHGPHKGRDVANLLEEAYKAGWDACRDKWSGMTYEETLEHGFIGEANNTGDF